MKRTVSLPGARRGNLILKIGTMALMVFISYLYLGSFANAQTNFTSTVAEPTGRPWIGFGYNQDPLDRDSTGGWEVAPWTPGHLSLLIQRMSAIKPSVVRIMLAEDYFFPSRVPGIYAWDSPQMQAVYQVFDWCKANNVRILTGPWSLSLADYGNVNSDDTTGLWLAGFTSTEYSQVCADLMYQLYVIKGYTNISYFTPQNEPPGCNGMTYEIYNTCLANLNRSFASKGIPTNIIAGPDAWQPFMHNAAQLSSQLVGSYENHAYADLVTVVSGTLEQMFRGTYGADIYQYDNTKPGLLGESGATAAGVIDLWYLQNPIPTDAPVSYTYGLDCFDYGLQVIRGGQSASMLWDLDGYSYGGYANGKDGGMWSWCTSNPVLGGTTLRPHFYSWSLLCNYFPTGMTMYRMTQPSGAPIRIAAGQQLNGDGSSHWTIGIVNQSGTAANITVQIPGWGAGTFDLFSFTPTNHGDGSSLALPSTTVSTSSLQNNGVVVSVPAQSCVLLTTLKRSAILAEARFSDPLDNLTLMQSKTANIAQGVIGVATTITLSDSSDGSVTYQYSNAAGFAVDLFGADGVADGRIRVYSSPDNAVWTQVPTTNTVPTFPLGDGYWAASTYSNSSVVPAGTNYLKINLVNGNPGWKTQVDKVTVFPGKITLFDPLNDLTRCYSSSNVALDNSQPWLTTNDTSRALNISSDKANLVYQVNNFSDFKVRVYGYNGAGALNFYTSPDGANWSPVTVAASLEHATLQSWGTFYYIPTSVISVGNNYLKIEFPAGSYWPTEIGDVTILTDRQPGVLMDQLFDSETMFSYANLFYLNYGMEQVLGSTNLFCPSNNTDNAVMIYRYPNVGSFDVKVFGANMFPNNKIQAFASSDSVNWTPIPTRNSAPDENDGYWADSHYTPSAAIPLNTNFLKFVLVDNDGVNWTSIANSVTIYPSALTVTSPTSATASNGGAFSYQITGSGTPTSYTAYGLPAGLVLNTSTGLISGTSTLTGTYSVTIGATSALGLGTQTLSIVVLPPIPVISSASTATGTNAIAFSYQISASNSPSSYGASGLPPGLSVNTGSGLISGTPSVNGTYGATVSAVNAGGTGSGILAITVQPGTPPPVPTGLTGVSGSAQATLNWSASTGATSYKVKRSLTSGSGYTTVATVTGTSTSNTGLTNGTFYYYVVTALNSAGESTNSGQVCAMPGSVPSPWQSTNIGAPGNIGGVNYSGTTFKLLGAGADIWGTSDAFRYTYQTGGTACSIIAKVTGLQNTNGSAKLGVMIRESLAANSTYAGIYITPTAGALSEYRSTTGGSAVNNKTTTGIAAPYWVKLVRTGSTFKSYISSNGSSWTLQGTETISMAGSVYIGLPVCSHSSGVLCSGTVTNVTATP